MKVTIATWQGLKKENRREHEIQCACYTRRDPTEKVSRRCVSERMNTSRLLAPLVKTITNWQKASTALEEINNPILNSIPNDIVSTDNIDNATGALTNHIRTVVKNSSKVVPANSFSKELSSDVGH
ncbi:hypothetical protein EVAR_95526_1 [Eumeta japonica]|uniref:Uncharacterized protein n=1 Tax=Eumeta variegata TaxID=151549 RepID=A0A4C1UIP8_EUMVA|nr:hypothetical protein EVAR_95526_1 [Eumeta japonica]